MTLISTPGDPKADSYISVSEADAYFTTYQYSSNSWASYDTTVKERALRQATKYIDQLKFYGFKRDTEQSLQFPRQDARAISGTAQSGTTTTLVDVLTLADEDQDYYNNIFLRWGLHIYDGTNKFERRLVTSNVKSTGTITVETAFPSVIDNTSEYILVEKVPDQLRWATVEVAWWFASSGDTDQSTTNAIENVEEFRVGNLMEKYKQDGVRLDTLQGVVLPYAAARLLSTLTSTTGVFA